ncbi:MAG TPA: exonuclease domain-containing protein [Candidatus Saccharimonadales bacterium]
MGQTGGSILDTPMVFVDIETNGLSHIRGRVIEVAAIRVENGRITRVFNQLIDPETELPFFITKLTGIRSEDLRGAMPFRQIAVELHDILSGAIFVAHNVRFDYSFLKQEFKRVNKTFLPKQLCTVKLSRTLYPEHKSHKLESLIARHGFSFEKRHRAYDDAHVLWQFLQLVHADFPAEIIQAAISRQLRQPALPKGLQADLIKELPETPGVYIFEDEQNKPLYIGKSINIKKRVLSHFGHDHDDSKEFKISQAIKHISTRTTGGELEALLLESRLVKEMMPLYNRKLRKTQKLLIARQSVDADGYHHVSLEEASQLEPDNLSSVLAVYARRNQARTSLDGMQKLYNLCPKLLGLEKSAKACFSYQLHKCRGACAGAEAPEVYNQRLGLAFERQRIRDWPYQGPVLVQERCTESTMSSGIIVDQWCVLAEVSQDEYCDPEIKSLASQTAKTFDLDTYKILQGFLAAKLHKLVIQPLSAQQLQQFGI